jgi:hypothetical protein
MSNLGESVYTVVATEDQEGHEGLAVFCHYYDAFIEMDGELRVLIGCVDAADEGRPTPEHTAALNIVERALDKRCRALGLKQTLNRVQCN